MLNALKNLTTIGGSLVIQGNSESFLPNMTGAFPALTSVGVNVTLAPSVSALTFNMDACFPALSTVTGLLSVNMTFTGGGDLSMVGSFPSLSSSAVRIRELGGSPSTLNLNSAFPALSVATPVDVFQGVELKDFNITDVTSAFGSLSVVNSLNLRPFPNGSLIPTFASLSAIVNKFQVQQAIGVDFSSTLPNLAAIGGDMIFQQSDGCAFPTFPALTTVGALFQFSDCINMTGVLPSFPALVSVDGQLQVNSNSFTAPTTGVMFVALARIGPVGGPYLDLNMQLNANVLPDVGSFPALVFVNGVNISTNAGMLTLAGLLPLATDIATVLIDGNPDLAVMLGSFNALATGTSFTVTNNVLLPETTQVQAVIDYIVITNSYPGATTNTGNLPEVDLTAAPDVYWTFDPPGPAPFFVGINEGTNGPGSAFTSDTGNNTIGATYGKVADGVAINYGGGGGGIFYGCPANATALTVSYAMWVRFNSDSTTDPHRFFISSNNASGGWAAFKTPSLAIEVFSEGGVEPLAGVIGTVPFLAGVWHHFAVTFNPVGPLVTLYCDGVADGTYVGDIANNLLVPGYPTTGWSRHGVTWEGSLDEILYFTRVLSPTEVLNIYNAGVANLKVTW